MKKNKKLKIIKNKKTLILIIVIVLLLFIIAIINKNVDNFDDTLIKDYIDNELISTVNKDIKKMVNSKEVNYLDLYRFINLLQIIFINLILFKYFF